MKDIEIARSVKLKNISLISEELGIREEDIYHYGNYIGKINNNIIKNYEGKEDGKLILVTAINPTPLGEGKTTISISIADALRRLHKKSILALREPSLGPVFGIKGGATGGGYSQIVPMEDINLHFTGDIHAITAANNLLSAIIDNHIYFGNELHFTKVVWTRSLDINDRALRNIEVSLNNNPRSDEFKITVASEIMAILCLSKDIFDLRRRIGNIIVGYNEDRPIYARDLKAEGALTVLLKDAIKPNLVQTLEKTPALVHGGPFANIAHGSNSIIATNMALKLGDYVVTEAGFGADLGCEKFLDIKCRSLGKHPDVVVLVATIKALKYHGGVLKEDILKENVDALKVGLNNLYHHVNTIKNVFGLNVVVAINKYDTDTLTEIECLENELSKNNILYSLVTSFHDGGEGALDIAKKLINILNEDEVDRFNYVYSDSDDIELKIKKVCQKVYGAFLVEFSLEARKTLEEIKKLKLDKYPICISKTQYSLSDDAKNLVLHDKFNIHVKDIYINNGAEFIVVMCGNIIAMPGLPKKPNSENIDILPNGDVVGIF